MAKMMAAASNAVNGFTGRFHGFCRTLLCDGNACIVQVHVVSLRHRICWDQQILTLQAASFPHLTPAVENDTRLTQSLDDDFTTRP